MMTTFDSRLRAKDYYVEDVSLTVATPFIKNYHYSMGCSRTRVYIHGLFDWYDDELVGIAWWLPPTRVACESVNRLDWKKVLSLSRMAIKPGVPKNACSFLLSQSTKLIRKDGRFVSLVTYADESQGHTGNVYKAANWDYVGRMSPQTRWIDSTGKQVAAQSTRTRTRQQMLDAGFIDCGKFHRHKYVKHLRPVRVSVYDSDDDF